MNNLAEKKVCGVEQVEEVHDTVEVEEVHDIVEVEEVHDAKEVEEVHVAEQLEDVGGNEMGKQGNKKDDKTDGVMDKQVQCSDDDDNRWKGVGGVTALEEDDTPLEMGKWNVMVVMGDSIAILFH